MNSEPEFELLYCLKKASATSFTQRDIARDLGLSLGKVNALIRDGAEKGLIRADDGRYHLTAAGEAALEPYRVDNAVIMAAGMSTRFAPLSYEKPKGLLKVRGEILIERQIRQLREAGITDITVVVGYLKEQFFYLEEKYGVRLVINEDYYRYNNTSTLIRVADRLKNTYLCSSDDYFVDNVFEPYVFRGYYAAVYAPGPTDEYCLACDAHGRIKGVTIGGENAWTMLGHVYFDRAFSERFTEILRREYETPQTREQLWENLYMRHLKELSLYIRKYDRERVLEFDSLEELRAFDPEYINNADSGILKNICRTLNCEIREIVDIEAIKAGLTNTSFRFSVRGEQYVYRHPGRGTEQYINRQSEAFSMKVAAENGLDGTFIDMDEKGGWKISHYISHARELDYHHPEEVEKALAIMRRLHALRTKSPYDFGIWNKTMEFLDRLQTIGKTDYEGFDELKQKMCDLEEQLKTDGFAVSCLCHNDCYAPNFLLDERGNMSLIDWEYSGNDDPASDLGTFICCSDYTEEEVLNVIRKYLDHEPEEGELRHLLGYVAIASYYWFLWALYQESRGNAVGEWLYLWYRNSRRYVEKTLAMF